MFLPEVILVCQVSLGTSLVWELSFSRMPQIIQICSKSATIPFGSVRWWNNEAELKLSIISSQNRACFSCEPKYLQASR